MTTNLNDTSQYHVPQTNPALKEDHLILQKIVTWCGFYYFKVYLQWFQFIISRRIHYVEDIQKNVQKLMVPTEGSKDFKIHQGAERELDETCGQGSCHDEAGWRGFLIFHSFTKLLSCF